MRVVVLGSGVIATTTAYYIADVGHEVVVLDRQGGPALETSYANAGEVSPGHVSSWTAPGIPLKALKWLFMCHRPLFIWPTPHPAKVCWALQMMRRWSCSTRLLSPTRTLQLSPVHCDGTSKKRECGETISSKILPGVE